MRVGSQRATLAMCRSPAVRLAHGDRERMKLIEEACMALRRVSGKSLTGEGGQRLVASSIAAGRGRQKMMPLTDSVQVLVGNWNRVAESVEQDGVSRLRTNARQSK